jgi:prepilin-type N-terminal cleavage/methylation domain-containing protein
MIRDPLDSDHPDSGPLGRRSLRAGFTLIELLIVIGIMAMLLAIAVPVVSRARAAANKVTCINNLRQLAGAFHLYAQQNDGLLPQPSATLLSWESSLLPFTTASAVFMCPSDSELYPAVGSSYDWRDTENSATTLAGVSVTAPRRSSLVLVFESLPGWHQPNRINAASLDGSATDMDYKACMRDLETDNSVALPP